MKDPFDEAIDGAVREMLDIEPPADLRARVVDVVSGFSRTSSGFSRTWWILPPLAAAAAIVLAVWIPWRAAPEPPAAPTFQARGDQRLPAPLPEPRVEESAGLASPVRATRTATSTPRIVLAAIAPLPEHATTVIEPLKSMAPITVAPIAQSSIEPDDIDIRPLKAIPELQLAPLTPPERR